MLSKASLPALFTILMSATLAVSQTGAAKSEPTGGNAQTSTTSGATQSGAQAPASGASHLPQAKTKEEYDAYNTASALTDPAKLEAAADAFAQKYPDSELRELLYSRAMSVYQHANNAEKVIEMGRKAIAINPTNPVPLVDVASALAETTRDGDLDRDNRLNEAAKDAQAAIANLDSGLQVPAGTPADRVAQVKSSIQSMAYDTLGVVDMNKKDFAAAEQNLLKAVDASKNQPEAVVYLRLSVAQDNLKKYPEALDSASKAVQYSAEGSAEQNLAKQQQARVQKLMANSTPSAGTATPVAPPTQPSAQTTPPPQSPTPH